VRARSLFIIVLGVAAVGITLVIATRPDGPTNGVQASSSCPHFTPMHGMMPLLFRVGILPKPPIAATVTPTDTSTSSIIRPDRNDQIQCGKAAIKSIEDIVYATPKLSNGKSASLKMDLLIPDPARKRVVVVYVPGGGFVVAGKEGALNLRTYVAEAGPDAPGLTGDRPARSATPTIDELGPSDIHRLTWLHDRELVPAE